MTDPPAAALVLDIVQDSFLLPTSPSYSPTSPPYSPTNMNYAPSQSNPILALALEPIEVEDHLQIARETSNMSKFNKPNRTGILGSTLYKMSLRKDARTADEIERCNRRATTSWKRMHSEFKAMYNQAANERNEANKKLAAPRTNAEGKKPMVVCDSDSDDDPETNALASDTTAFERKFKHFQATHQNQLWEHVKSEFKAMQKKLDDTSKELDDTKRAHQSVSIELSGQKRLCTEMEASFEHTKKNTDDAEETIFRMAETMTKMRRRLVEATDNARGARKPEQEKNGCVCCLTNTAVWAMVPCGHVVVCDTCKPRIANDRTCPQCRTEHLGAEQGFLKLWTSGIDIFDENETNSIA